MRLTITEALAELKLIESKSKKKQEFVLQYVARNEAIRDPLDKDGGSRQVLAQEMQAVHDLGERRIRIRRAISAANDATSVKIGESTRSITDWLIWRREVAPGIKTHLAQIMTGIEGLRKQAQARGNTVVTSQDAAMKQNDVVVNVDERDIHRRLETIQEALDTLDGQLSLKNATVFVEIDD